MKKRILAALVASAAVLSLAGCNTNDNSNSGANNSNSNNSSNNNSESNPDNSTPATPADVPDDGDCLTILTWSGNSDTKTMVEFFLEKKGYSADKVKFVGVGENGEAARDGYRQYFLGDEDADLIIMDADWVQDYVCSDDTLSYESIGLSKSDFPDAFSYTLAFGTDESGVLKANSFQATPGGFVYRADLAKEYLGVETPEAMQELVKDWDTFEATAKKVYETSGGKCSLQSTEGGLWQVFQSNRNQPWVVDGKLVMDNAEDFYDIAKRMSDDKGIAGVGQWSAAWYASVFNGDAMGDFAPTWGLTTNAGSILYNFANETKEQQAVDENGNPKVDDEGKPVMEIVAVNGSESSDKMKICEGPSGWYWGGSYIGVAKKCNNKTLAKEFIEFFCKDADSMKAYAEKTKDFVNNKTVMGSLDSGNTLLGGQNHYAILSKVMDNLNLEGKITKYDSKIKGLFNDSVNGYINGEFSTKEEAINSFKLKVAEAYPNDIVVE